MQIVVEAGPVVQLETLDARVVECDPIEQVPQADMMQLHSNLFSHVCPH